MIQMTKAKKTQRQTGSVILGVLFALNLTVIGLVSLYDCHLTEKYQWGLKDHEENPIARLLLEESDWKVESFIALKLVGTVAVIGFILLLYRIRSHMAHAVCWGVALFQILLVVFYLEFDDIMLLFM